MRARKFSQAYDLIAELTPFRLNLLVRTLLAYFHLTTICEEDHLAKLIGKLEAQTRDGVETPTNELLSAYQRVCEASGQKEAERLLKMLEFHPFFTAHPTEARRPSTETKIMLITRLLYERPQATGIDKALNGQHMLEAMDALPRTSPVGMVRPTPAQEANVLVSLFDYVLFDLVPNVYQRLNDLIMGEDAATKPPVTPAFIKPGACIASDRDGNPHVTTSVTREVAETLRVHVLERYVAECMRVGYLLTFDSLGTPPSPALKRLWHRMDQTGDDLCAPMSELVTNEYH